MNRSRLLVHASLFAVALAAAATAHAAASGDPAAIADAADTDPDMGIAQALPARPADTKADTKEEDGTILVTGVRNSLAKAREKKRQADTIVDIVEAEDIGKLPNNTVGDVVASIPGIAVYRTEGEVNDIQLRGIGGVQTTMGGTPIESGADRVASIADLPADLVQSVEVYKTRTPDQVEGSGAGTINIELRKPVDFKEGFTFSGNATARYNTQSRRYNQVYSAIVNYRRETGIGDLGLQLGFTVNHNPFLESQARNDPLTTVQTRQVVGPQILPQPTFAPSQVAFFYTTGARTTPSFNTALQWSPDDETTLTLEGFYAKPNFDRFTNQLFMPVLLQAGSTNNLPALSNITLVPGTNRMASVTVSPVTQVGPISYISEENNSNFQVKIKGRRNTEQVDLSAEIAYGGANNSFQQYEVRNRFVNRPTYDIEFASDKFKYPMMNLNFRDLDLLDPNQYRFFGLNEFAAQTQNRTLATRADVTIRTFWDPIEYIKAGMRFTDRTSQRREQSRGVSGLQIERGQLPKGWNELLPIAEGFGGTAVKNNARWLSYDRFAARDNYDAMRQYLVQFNPTFATEENVELPARDFNGNERTVAAYATIGYRTKLIFPIDGLFGARVTNTVVSNRAFGFRTTRIVTPTGATTVVVTEPRNGSGNYLNIEPSATGVIHFTPQLQARLSYGVGIRRPNVDQITPGINFNELNFTGSGGNPNLQPEKTTRYDASLEWYFGKTGIITVNPFYWNLDGTFFTFETLEYIEPDDPLPSRVFRPYNAGEGYRRGVEMQAQTFFTFLPGILKNFGISANYTYVESRLAYNRLPDSTTAPPAPLPLVRTPKHVYNIAALFERGTLNARLSYNYNGSVLDSINGGFVRASTYVVPRDWMDAAINYSIPKGPLKNLGFSLQVQNVMAGTRRSFYGYADQPRDVIYMARTYGGTIRYRF